jgi:hypothetical protein
MRLATLEEALRPFARIARALERGDHGTLSKDHLVMVHSPRCDPIDKVPFSAFLAAECALAEVRIRRRLDKHHSLYEAEKWLASPQKIFDGDVPLDLIRGGRGHEIDRYLDKVEGIE